MLNENSIWQLIDNHASRFIKLSDDVFDTPETLFAEFRS